MVVYSLVLVHVFGFKVVSEAVKSRPLRLAYSTKEQIDKCLV